ncbi:O-antigen ligase family protein [bacterium]|nr:O-antigen ligase family protein [bacterium]MBU1753786.1 O-antigen ligase family protein [bacterium]
MREKTIVSCSRIIDAGLIVFVLSLPLSVSGTEIGYYTALLAWIILMTVRKEVKLPSTPLDCPIIFFWLISVISIVFSINPSISITMLKKLPYFFLPYLMVDNIKDKKKLLTLIQALLISTTITASFGVFNYINGAARAYSSIGEHYILEVNALATFLIMVFPFAIVLVIYRKSLWLRIMNGFMALVIMSSIILTYSRSTYLGLAGIAIMGFFVKRIRYVSLSIFCLLIILFLASTVFRDKIEGMSHDGQERLYMWQIGWQMLKDHPFTGVGADCIEIEYPKYMTPCDKWPIRNNLHNNFIQEMAAKGIGGLIAFLYLLGAFFLTGVKTYKKSIPNDQKGIILGCMAGYIGFVIDGCFESTFFSWLWLFIMGVCLVINNHCFVQEKSNV